MAAIPVITLKKKLRSEVLKRRRALSHEQRELESRRICEKILTNSLFANAKNILCYVSLDDEVSTYDLLKKMACEKRIFVPRICNDKIVPTAFTNHETLVLGAFGILEPPCPIEPYTSPKIDLIIMPGVAFDRAGNRIGMGKGFYDRFLKTMAGVPAFGVAFEIQVVDKVPTDAYDVPVSFLVTPNNFITCRPTTSKSS